MAAFVRETLDGGYTGFARDLLQSQSAHQEVMLEKLTVKGFVDPAAMRSRHQRERQIRWNLEGPIHPAGTAGRTALNWKRWPRSGGQLVGSLFTPRRAAGEQVVLLFEPQVEAVSLSVPK